MLQRRIMIEQSLTEFLALSGHDAWSSLVSRQLPRPRRSDRACRLQPLHARRTGVVAARGGSHLSKFRRRQRNADARADLGNQRARRMRNGLSAPRLGFG